MLIGWPRCYGICCRMRSNIRPTEATFKSWQPDPPEQSRWRSKTTAKESMSEISLLYSTGSFEDGAAENRVQSVSDWGLRLSRNWLRPMADTLAPTPGDAAPASGLRYPNETA